MIPLGLLKRGEKGKIIKVRTKKVLEGLGESEKECRGCFFCKETPKKKEIIKTKTLGLIEGKLVEILKNDPGEPLLVKIENTYLAIPRELAMKIFIEMAKVKGR